MEFQDNFRGEAIHENILIPPPQPCENEETESDSQIIEQNEENEDQTTEQEITILLSVHLFQNPSQ